MPAALLFRPDWSHSILHGLDPSEDYLNPNTWTGATGYSMGNGRAPAWSFVGGGMSPAVLYSAAVQLIFSRAGSMPSSVNELVSSWRSWNGFAVESLDVMPPKQAFQIFTDGRRSTPMWLEGYGYKLQWPGDKFGSGNYIRMTSQPCSALVTTDTPRNNHHVSLVNSRNVYRKYTWRLRCAYDSEQHPLGAVVYVPNPMLIRASLMILHVCSTPKVHQLLDVREDGGRSVAQPFVCADGVAIAGPEHKCKLGASRRHSFILSLGHNVFHQQRPRPLARLESTCVPAPASPPCLLEGAARIVYCTNNLRYNYS